MRFNDRELRIFFPVKGFVLEAVAGLFAGKVKPGFGFGRADGLRRAVKDDGAPSASCARSHIDDAVGGKHHLGIVFHHHERIARLFEVFKNGVDAVHVPRMQADRGFIEHKQRVGEVGAQGRGEAYALDFASGERAALAVKREVTEAHVHEVDEAPADFAENERSRLIGDVGGNRVEKGFQTCNRQQHQIVHRKARKVLVDARGDTRKAVTGKAAVEAFAGLVLA